MSKYVIHTFNNNKYVISEKQRKGIEESSAKEIWFKDGRMIRRTSISEINKLENESPQKVGYNSRGRKFIKINGQWKDAENINSQLQLEHFPEVAKDQLMTKEQYEESIKEESEEEKEFKKVSGEKEDLMLKDGNTVIEE